jgi:hypothetical protein
MVEIHKCVAGPELIFDFLSGDQRSGVLQEHGQDLQGLVVQLHSDAGLA